MAALVPRELPVPRHRDEVDLGPTGLLRSLTRDVGLVPLALGVAPLGDVPVRAVSDKELVDRVDNLEGRFVEPVERGSRERTSHKLSANNRIAKPPKITAESSLSRRWNFGFRNRIAENVPAVIPTAPSMTIPMMISTVPSVSI
jgi:hypothetical protein